MEYVRELWKDKKIGWNFKRLRTKSYFQLKINLREASSESVPSVPSPPPMPSTSKSYDEVGLRQKQRITARLRSQNDPNALVDAAVQHFRSIKDNDAAFVVKKLRDEPFELGKKLRDVIVNPQEEFSQVSNQEL